MSGLEEMLGKPKEKKPGIADEIDEDDQDTGGIKGAARDVLKAIKMGDPDALASALHLAFIACKDEEDAEGEGDKEEY